MWRQHREVTTASHRMCTSPAPATHLPNSSTPNLLLPHEIALPTAKMAHPSEIVRFLEMRSDTLPATMPVKALGTRMDATTIPRTKSERTPNWAWNCGMVVMAPIVL